jgi:anti-sigma B factor antagonist
MPWLGVLLFLAFAGVMAFTLYARSRRPPPRTFAISTRGAANGVTVLDFEAEGDLEESDIERIESALVSVYEKGRVRLVVNLSKLGFVTVDGWGAILKDLWRLRRAGGDIRLCDPSGPARRMVAELGLGGRLKLFEAEDRAIASYASEDPPKALDDERLSIYLDAGEEKVPGARVVTFSGSLDARTLPAFQGALDPLLAVDRPRVVLDLDRVENATPDAWVALMAARDRTRRAGGELHLVYASGVVAKTGKVLGFDRMVPVHATREKALEALRQGG